MNDFNVHVDEGFPVFVGGPEVEAAQTLRVVVPHEIGRVGVGLHEAPLEHFLQGQLHQRLSNRVAGLLIRIGVGKYKGVVQEGGTHDGVRADLREVFRAEELLRVLSNQRSVACELVALDDIVAFLFQFSPSVVDQLPLRKRTLLCECTFVWERC